MGLYDRDYYREDPNGSARWPGGRVTLVFMLLLGATFALQLLSNSTQGLDVIKKHGCFMLDPVLRGEIWRVFTAPLVHPSLSLFALICSLLVLYFFGRSVESELGGPEFLRFLLAALLLAQMLEFLIRLSGLANPDVRSSGMAAGLAAILVLYACRYPHAKILLFFIIPVPAWLIAALLVGTATLAMIGNERLGVPSLPLAGAGFALIYHFAGLNLGKLARTRQPSFRRKPKLRVLPYEPQDHMTQHQRKSILTTSKLVADEHLEARVDGLLRKVAETGPDSLTDEEKQTLLRASELYRRRRN